MGSVASTFSQTKRALLASALLLTAFAAGCEDKFSTVQLTIDARTNQGEPVLGAAVLLDGKSLGATDNLGGFRTEVSLPVGASARLEVRKDSDDYYFAPYFDAFTVGEGAVQERSVAATLYFVPKPKPNGEGKEDPPEVPLAKEEPAPVPEVPVVTATDATAANETAAAVPVPVPAPGVEAEVAPLEEPAAVAEVAAATAVAEVTPVTPSVTEDAAAQDLEEVAAAVPVEDAAAIDAGAAHPDEITEPVSGVTGAGGISESAVAILPAVADAAPSPGVSAASAPLGGASTYSVAPAAPATDAVTGNLVYTIHVFAPTGAGNGEAPLPGVEVRLGQGDSKSLADGCMTNARGRCVIRFKERPEGPVTFVASKAGYRTASRGAPIKNQGQLRISLSRGLALDVYAMSRAYGSVEGLEGVEVHVDGKMVGSTDKFGRYSYAVEGAPDALLAIALKPRGVLPESWETDFVAAGADAGDGKDGAKPLTLVKYFAATEPPAARVAILAPRPAGPVDAKTGELLSGALDAAIRGAAKKHLFASAAFKEVQTAAFEQAARESGRTATEALRSGWQGTALKTSVDALLSPTAITGTAPALELAVVDAQGRVLAAAREELDSLSDQTSVDRAMAVLAKKIARAFPFEGAVLGRDGSQATINVGLSHGRGVKPGDILDVYGTQAEKRGRTQAQARVATLTVKEVVDAQSKCVVTWIAPRATVERGDLVVLRPRKAPDASAAQVRVIETGKGTPVAQANVYLNDRWLGATDSSGRVWADVTGTGTLRVVKSGFGAFSRATALATAGKVEVGLAREAAFLRVESTPAGATVKVDGQIVGKTPLATPVPVPTGFVKLELEGVATYKNYSQVLELDEGTLDLTGPRAVMLERDWLAEARRLTKAERYAEAAAKYQAVPKTHSDFLYARHELGELYLTQLDQPALAAAAFGEVTADPAVAQFTDKRFIGSRVDEGVALYLTATRLADSAPEEAKAHYLKAIEVLDAAAPYLRFVPGEQYALAVHNLEYHRALARHKLWQLAPDPRLLAEAVKTWRAYLDGSARAVPADDATKAYVENAQVYYKQALASPGAPRGTSRQ